MCVCGYHIYKAIWMAAEGEVLQCEREPFNASNASVAAVRGPFSGYPRDDRGQARGHRYDTINSRYSSSLKAVLFVLLQRNF